MTHHAVPRTGTVICNVFELQQSIQDNRSFQRLKAYDFGYYAKVTSNEVTIVLNIDMEKQGLDVSGRANFMLRLQTPSVRSPYETSNTSCIMHGTCSQAYYIHGLPEYVDQFTIAISHNTDVTKLKHHTGLSQAEKSQTKSACD